MTSKDDLPPLPDEYLTEIGRVCYQWSVLEGMFDLWLAKLVGLEISDLRSKALFAHMAFPLKLDLFGSFANYLKPHFPNLSEHKNVLSSLRRAQDSRNLVVHAMWAMDESGEHANVLRLTARGEIKPSTKKVTLEELRAIPEQIKQTTLELHRFVVRGSGKTPSV